MTVALDFLTGFEHGVLSTAGGGLFSSMGTNGFESISSTTVRSGTYSLRINQSAVAGGGWVSRTVSGLPTALAVRFYFRFPSLPVNGTILAMLVPAAGKEGYFGYSGSSGTGRAGVIWQGDAFQTGVGVEIQAGVWYRADIEARLAGNPRVIECQVAEGDGPSLGGNETTSAEAASAFLSTTLGNNHNNETYDCYFDDWGVIKSSTAYPIGAGKAVSILPTADGTHSPASPDCVENGAGTLISGGTPAYQYLDDKPLATSTTTDRIQTRTAHASDYVEWTHADLTADQTTINAVRALAVAKNPTADPATCAVVVRDNDGQETGIIGTSAAPATLTNSVLEYTGKIVTTPSGGWTLTQVNALKGRFGYSTDVSPKPGLYSFMLEVDVAPLDLTVQDASHAHAADNLALTQIHQLAVADSNHAHAADNVALTQGHVLVVADSSHAHAVDNVALDETPATVLTVQDGLHALTSDAVLFIPDYALVASIVRPLRRKPGGVYEAAAYFGVPGDTVFMSWITEAKNRGYDVGESRPKR